MRLHDPDSRARGRMARKPAPLPDTTSDDLATVIEGLLASEPAERLSVDRALAILLASDARVATSDDIAAIAGEWSERRDAKHGHGPEVHRGSDGRGEHGLLSAAEEHLIRWERARLEPEPEPVARPRAPRSSLRWLAGLLLLLVIPVMHHWIQVGERERAAATPVPVVERGSAPGRDGAAVVSSVTCELDSPAEGDSSPALAVGSPGQGNRDARPVSRRTRSGSDGRASSSGVRRTARPEDGRQSGVVVHGRWRRTGARSESLGGWQRVSLHGD